MTNEDESWMRQAIALARKGEGWVEPNPMVGCVIVRDNILIGEGYHEKFGGPHAEVNAILDVRRNRHEVRNATAFVTLEPCSHTGKTGPCVRKLIDEGIGRVVVGHEDPFPEVSGTGIAQLRAAGIEVKVGVLENECRALNLPYLTRVCQNRPWVIAKWAMSLDGKIATKTGDSRWITSSDSRQLVQQLRGRVDGILVGSKTALIDDPMLTARPTNKQYVSRVATRIVLDSSLRIELNSKLVTTSNEYPTLVVCGPQASKDQRAKLEMAGCQVLQFPEADLKLRLQLLLSELAKRGMTNLLVEGGSQVFAMLVELSLIDELRVFVGNKLIGGAGAPSPVGGEGHELMAEVESFELVSTRAVGHDLYSIFRRRNQLV